MPYNSRKGAKKIVESVSGESLYGQLVIFNESPQEINEDIQFTKMDNFKLVGVVQGQNKINVVVQPGNAQAILLLR